MEWLGKGAPNKKLYVGIKGNKVTYVGQSNNPARRIGEHHKEFERFDTLRPLAEGLTQNEASALELLFDLKNPHFTNSNTPISMTRNVFQGAPHWAEDYCNARSIQTVWP